MNNWFNVCVCFVYCLILAGVGFEVVCTDKWLVYSLCLYVQTSDWCICCVCMYRQVIGVSLCLYVQTNGCIICLYVQTSGWYIICV